MLITIKIQRRTITAPDSILGFRPRFAGRRVMLTRVTHKF
jgi:hypothetical protein